MNQNQPSADGKLESSSVLPQLVLAKPGSADSDTGCDCLFGGAGSDEIYVRPEPVSNTGGSADSSHQVLQSFLENNSQTVAG